MTPEAFTQALLAEAREQTRLLQRICVALNVDTRAARERIRGRANEQVTQLGASRASAERRRNRKAG